MDPNLILTKYWTFDLNKIKNLNILLFNTLTYQY
jgi:hypothetical protein